MVSGTSYVLSDGDCGCLISVNGTFPFLGDFIPFFFYFFFFFRSKYHLFDFTLSIYFVFHSGDTEMIP